MQTIILAYSNTMGLNLSVVTGCGNKSKISEDFNTVLFKSKYFLKYYIFLY